MDPIFHIDLLRLGGLVLLVGLCITIVTFYAAIATWQAVRTAWRCRWRRAAATMPSGNVLEMRVRRVDGTLHSNWRASWEPRFDTRTAAEPAQVGFAF